MSCLAMLSGERFSDQRSKRLLDGGHRLGILFCHFGLHSDSHTAQRPPRSQEHQPGIQSGTVPVIVRRSAASCVFLRSAETHNSLFFLQGIRPRWLAPEGSALSS
jgi:hypothetical protein